MAGLFSSGEQDMLGNIVQQRQQANQALGQNYGKYSGIVQAGQVWLTLALMLCLGVRQAHLTLVCNR
jgi:hypothetical protein